MFSLFEMSGNSLKLSDFSTKLSKSCSLFGKKMEFSVRDVGTLENTKNGTLVVAEINATIS